MPYAIHICTRQLLAMIQCPFFAPPCPCSPIPSNLLHNSRSTQRLERLDNLLGLLLGNALLHHLWRALDELLAVHERQPQHALDLLDHLGLRPGVKLLQLQVEQRLLGGSRCGLLLFNGRSGRTRAGGGESAHGHVGDVEAGLLISCQRLPIDIDRDWWLELNGAFALCIVHDMQYVGCRTLKHVVCAL